VGVTRGDLVGHFWERFIWRGCGEFNLGKEPHQKSCRFSSSFCICIYFSSQLEAVSKNCL